MFCGHRRRRRTSRGRGSRGTRRRRRGNSNNNNNIFVSCSLLLLCVLQLKCLRFAHFFYLRLSESSCPTCLVIYRMYTMWIIQWNLSWPDTKQGKVLAVERQSWFIYIVEQNAKIPSESLLREVSAKRGVHQERFPWRGVQWAHQKSCPSR